MIKEMVNELFGKAKKVAQPAILAMAAALPAAGCAWPVGPQFCYIDDWSHLECCVDDFGYEICGPIGAVIPPEPAVSYTHPTQPGTLMTFRGQRSTADHFTATFVGGDAYIHGHSPEGDIVDTVRVGAQNGIPNGHVVFNDGSWGYVSELPPTPNGVRVNAQTINGSVLYDAFAATLHSSSGNNDYGILNIHLNPGVVPAQTCELVPQGALGSRPNMPDCSIEPSPTGVSPNIIVTNSSAIRP